MEIEAVKFESSRVRFELTSRRPGLTTMRAIYRGKEVVHTSRPAGRPGPAGGDLSRAAPAARLDVMTLASKMAA